MQITRGVSSSVGVSPLREEIRNPLAVVSRLYKQAAESGDTEGDWGVPAHFKKVLKKEWNKVFFWAPLLHFLIPS